MMKKIFVKGLGTIGALSSVQSGIFWYLSAQNQLVSAGKISSSSTTVEKLAYLASQQNFWGATFAMVAGFAIGIAVLIDD
jgi:hypothetical protein